MKISTIVLGLALAGLGASSGFAQTATQKPKSDVRTITGCLSKGDSADEYLLTAKDGSTWELKSSTAVNLATHVGHTVTVKGTVENATAHNLKEDAKTTAADAGVKKTDTEHGHLKPTEVAMVSESCK